MKPFIAGAKQEGTWMKNIKWWENNEPIHIELLHDKCHSDDHVHDHETYTQYEEAKNEQNVKNGIYILPLPLVYIMYMYVFANPTHMHVPQMQDQHAKKGISREIRMMALTCMMLNMIKWILLKNTKRVVKKASSKTTRHTDKIRKG